jgi:hypothetical protein
MVAGRLGLCAAAERFARVHATNHRAVFSLRCTVRGLLYWTVRRIASSSMFDFRAQPRIDYCTSYEGRCGELEPTPAS